MVPGYTIPVPNIDVVANADILGMGGNGKTFKYHLNQKEFAVKWVRIIYLFHSICEPIKRILGLND